jgi:ferredoxin
MRIRIDKDVCSGHGRCFTVAPEAFDFDDEGFGVVKFEAVPAQFEAVARRAVDGCPEQAIVLDED